MTLKGFFSRSQHGVEHVGAVGRSHLFGILLHVARYAPRVLVMSGEVEPRHIRPLYHHAHSVFKLPHPNKTAEKPCTMQRPETPRFSNHSKLPRWRRPNAVVAGLDELGDEPCSSPTAGEACASRTEVQGLPSSGAECIADADEVINGG